MTCECGRPDCAGVPQRTAIAEAIRTNGQFIVAVLGDEEQAPFVYTIGRTERGWPELLIELEDNQDIRAAGLLLNALLEHDLQPGQQVMSEGLNGLFLVIPEPEGDDYLHEVFVTHADRYYGRPVTVLCLVAEPQPQAKVERLH